MDRQDEKTAIMTACCREVSLVASAVSRSPGSRSSATLVALVTGIAYCGRYGDWAYIWTDQSFVSGENALNKVLSKASSMIFTGTQAGVDNAAIQA